MYANLFTRSFVDFVCRVCFNVHYSTLNGLMIAVKVGQPAKLMFKLVYNLRMTFYQFRHYNNFSLLNTYTKTESLIKIKSY